MVKKNDTRNRDKARMAAIAIISLLVILSGALFSVKSFMEGEIAGGIIGIFIAAMILAFAFVVFRRGNRDLKQGLPLQDERSRRVMEKASSLAFYVSLYLLLAVGFFSDGIIKFRDVSQATGLAVGGMALLFAVFWAYYNKKGI
ncbi:DUF2178 domain-containing protein [Candidatus Woesearchaeota archaeon]|nr:DUF2178 domain-containing protein [Candidatus Woesearchaeota archaeon]